MDSKIEVDMCLWELLLMQALDITGKILQNDHKTCNDEWFRMQSNKNVPKKVMKKDGAKIRKGRARN